MENSAVNKASCYVSLMSQEVSGAGTFFAACPMLDQPVVVPAGSRPRADSLLTTSICIPTLGLPKHVSVVQIPVDCRHASTIEAAHWPFPHELWLPTSDRHNRKKCFFLSVKALIKLLELHMDGLETRLK